jgi:DNA mismatch endonuclease (patch repair protein)
MSYEPFASTPAIRRRMQGQRRRDTRAELALRRELHRRGLRYRLDQPVVPGTRRRRVDIVFLGAKVAVSVDGCFWHGCAAHGVAEHRVNAWYWPAKIERNRARDADTDARLSAEGWAVVRVWEHDDPVAAADRIERIVRRRRRGERTNQDHWTDWVAGVTLGRPSTRANQRWRGSWRGGPDERGQAGATERDR